MDIDVVDAALVSDDVAVGEFPPASSAPMSSSKPSEIATDQIDFLKTSLAADETDADILDVDDQRRTIVSDVSDATPSKSIFPVPTDFISSAKSSSTSSSASVSTTTTPLRSPTTTTTLNLQPVGNIEGIVLGPAPKEKKQDHVLVDVIENAVETNDQGVDAGNERESKLNNARLIEFYGIGIRSFPI